MRWVSGVINGKEGYWDGEGGVVSELKGVTSQKAM